MKKSDKLTEKQKHVYGEIVNYVKMLNEEKTRMDLNLRLKKDDQKVYLEEKLNVLRGQIGDVQKRFKELCTCKGEANCECDLD